MNWSLSTWRRRWILPQNILGCSHSDKSRFSMTMVILFMVRVSMIPRGLKFDLTPILLSFYRIACHCTIHCPEICQSRYPGLNSRWQRLWSYRQIRRGLLRWIFSIQSICRRPWFGIGFQKVSSYFQNSLASKNSPSTTRFRGEEPDPDAVAKHTASLQKKLDAYDKILGKRKYLAGDVIVLSLTLWSFLLTISTALQHVTLADLFHLSFGELLINVLKIDILSTRPNLAKWWNDISTRESWKVVNDSA